MWVPKTQRKMVHFGILSVKNPQKRPDDETTLCNNDRSAKNVWSKTQKCVVKNPKMAKTFPDNMTLPIWNRAR